jgi:excisionase family DNA binding protein
LRRKVRAADHRSSARREQLYPADAVDTCKVGPRTLDTASRVRAGRLRSLNVDAPEGRASVSEKSRSLKQTGRSHASGLRSNLSVGTEPMSFDQRPPNTTDEFLTVAEVATLLKLNPQTVRNWIDQDKLAAVRVGRRVRVTRADLERFIQEGYKPGTVASGDEAVNAGQGFWDGDEHAPSEGANED